MKMKAHAQQALLKDLYREMESDYRRQQDEELDRLHWEVDRAISNLVEALMRREQERNDEAGRRADLEIAAGRNPF